MSIYINPEHAKAVAQHARKETLEGFLAKAERKAAELQLDFNYATPFEKIECVEGLTFDARVYGDWIDSMDESNAEMVELFLSFAKTIKDKVQPKLEPVKEEPVSNTVPPVKRSKRKKEVKKEETTEVKPQAEPEVKTETVDPQVESKSEQVDDNKQETPTENE